MCPVGMVFKPEEAWWTVASAAWHALSTGAGTEGRYGYWVLGGGIVGTGYWRVMGTGYGYWSLIPG